MGPVDDQTARIRIAPAPAQTLEQMLLALPPDFEALRSVDTIDGFRLWAGKWANAVPEDATLIAVEDHPDTGRTFHFRLIEGRHFSVYITPQEGELQCEKP